MSNTTRHTMTRGDSARIAQDRLVWNGVMLDLSTAMVHFILRSVDTGQTLKREAAKLNPASPDDPNVEYKFIAADVATAGLYEAEWEITFDNGDQLTLPAGKKYTIDIQEDLG